MWNSNHFIWTHAEHAFESNFGRFQFLCGLYILSVAWYRPGKAFSINQRLIGGVERFWNFTSFIFSAICAVGVILRIHTLNQAWPSSLIFWLFWFSFLKPMEFIDTWLLMAKGKPISLLHWTHHLLTAQYCWYTGLHPLHSIDVVFALLNLIVHTVMYLYYFLTAFSQYKQSIQKYAVYVTRLQITQFLLGIVALMIYAPFIPLHKFIVTMAMYGYYLLMFWPLLNRRR